MAQYVAANNLSPTTSNPPATSAAAAPPAPSSAAAAAAQPGSAQHKRVYQACIPCRRRKVRCDLGSVDNPHDPPCVRCRRESKECYFSATRRKRKTEDGVDEPEEVDEYTIRNGRKRLHVSDSPPVAIDRRLYSEVPLTPGGSIGRTQPLRRPTDPGVPTSSHGAVTPSTVSQADSSRRAEFGTFEDEPNAQLENHEAADLMRPGVYGPHDALDLLYKAATDRSVQLRIVQDAAAYPPAHSPATNHHKRHESVASIPAMPPQPVIVTPGATMKPMGAGRPSVSVQPEAQPIDPELLSTKRDLSGEPGYQDAVKAWGRFRFVRAGWFSAQEAIEYIDYYYEYLSPLTPISPPTFRNPASHLTLLTEEPILTITLLTISSRYRKIPGTGGHCRSHAIHEQLWTYLRGMIERCLWGQEAFGGGFAAMAGASSVIEDQTSSTAPWRGMRKGSLRTLGTVESLMILTEWHPRALHFPPAEAIDELMLPSYEGSDLISTDENGNQRPSANIGGRRLDSWLEPAWRSDRMCWMLLSTAMGLAYELGVFDDIDELLRDGAITRPEYEEETYRQRANRIKRLLLIYLTQLAGRLGWTSMVPEVLRKSDPAVTRRRPVSTEGTTPGTNPSSMSNAFNYIPDLELDDQIIHCWAGISNAMHIGNEKFFRSRKHTTDIIQSGKYTDLLKEFQPLLQDWWKEFERYRLPPYIRHILTIEYEYVRIYVNSLSLQAVVERCTNNAERAGHVAHGNHNAGSAAQLSPQTQNYFGKLPLGQLGGFGATDQEYIKEVISGSRNLLRTVVEGLLPGEYLKHAPVRTYFRIISGAMFLLKTFALGAPRSDVKMSIDLMDQTVEALRNCVVDDVHLGIRFADLLESLTRRLRNRFIQAPTLGHASADGRSPDPHGVTDGAGAANGQVVNGVGGQNWSNHPGKLGLGTHEDPNAISATPFDLTTGNFPYPSGAASVLGPSTPAPHPETTTNNNNTTTNNTAGSTSGMDNLFDSTDWNNPSNEMWYLPTGPAFFQNMDNTAVAMTAEGVNVGGLDLLEYMAMDNFNVMEGTSNGAPPSYP
ncbi:fungal zn binuclear cluster domain containing protein [Colletotrichum karsti]|uniref:Fungal zn binuclear cluster domain containing protein n=1 Tax=Colletotrichum karsti TaxID=1095194 RepID=A0A9P6LJ36_9PEZI|nr:fungal zn binuclear cluster domain containing protein [Colletotrichum karsti]KAF9877949.1 fungal zn binuclear cluster domain containing protein [Colletotrichum karsti]